MSALKKVLWPISPTDSEAEADKKLYQFLKVFRLTLENVELQPIYVLSAQFFATSDYFEPIDVTDLKDNMLKEAEAYLNKNFQGLTFNKPVVIENNFNSQGAEVALLCQYIEQNSPDYVVMTTHGRSGWSRAFLGSFTESLLLKSRVPTILIGPDCEPIKALKTALMPVQLNDSSRNFVEGFLDDHRLAFLENLTLFHKISMVDIEEIAWAPALYGLGNYTGQDIIEKAKQSSESYLKAFLDHPLSQKRLAYKVSEKLGAIGDIIIEEASAFDVTVMRSECGAVEANLLGSVTRDVIRHSKTPVIVYPHLFASDKSS